MKPIIEIASLILISNNKEWEMKSNRMFKFDTQGRTDIPAPLAEKLAEHAKKSEVDAYDLYMALSAAFTDLRDTNPCPEFSREGRISFVLVHEVDVPDVVKDLLQNDIDDEVDEILKTCLLKNFLRDFDYKYRGRLYTLIDQRLDYYKEYI